MTGDDPEASYGRQRHNRPNAQQVMNQAWPFHDANGRHARGIDDQPNPIDVYVTVELERDGLTEVEGVAARWYRQHVYVQTNDPRVPRPGVWVLATAVRRR